MAQKLHCFHRLLGLGVSPFDHFPEKLASRFQAGNSGCFNWLILAGPAQLGQLVGRLTGVNRSCDSGKALDNRFSWA